MDRGRTGVGSRTIAGMPDTRNAPGLSPRLRAFLDTTNFATIATIDPDGSPRQAVIWYTLDDDAIVINSRVGRRWPTNLLRDARVAIAITDRTDGYRWIGLTARASPIFDQRTAQADIAGMARRYHADDPAEVAESIARFETQERISFRVPIDDVHDHLD